MKGAVIFKTGTAPASGWKSKHLKMVGYKNGGIYHWRTQVGPNDCLGFHSHTAPWDERLHDVCYNPIAIAAVQRACYVSPRPVQSHQWEMSCEASAMSATIQW